MRISLFLILFFISTHLINAQDNCFEIKEDIDSYKSLIKRYDRDSERFSQEILQYSERLNDKTIKEKHDLSKIFLAVVERDKLTAILNKERLERDLKKYYVERIFFIQML